MTQEEKAKRYDETLEQLRGLIEGTREDKCAIVEEDIIDIFTELKESEDERIRKAIITFFESEDDNTTYALVPKKDILAWLEKQDKQNPNDKYTFKSIPRLLEMIKPTSRAKAYCKKLIDSLLQEGYATDAKIVSDCLKQMNGEKVAMATMDEQNPINEVVPKFKVRVLPIEEKSPVESLGISPEEYEEMVNECIYGFDYKDANIQQKDFASKIEPKFKIGDWLCENEPNNYARFIQILKTSNAQGKERYRISRDIHNDEDVVELDFIEKYYHKFDIADAKDGDVLFHSDSASNGIFIFKKIIDRGFAKEIICYCDYDSEDHFCLGEHHTCCWTNAKILRPAIKEQRDTLKKAMADAGWEFDFEKKELRKVEQKLDNSAKVNKNDTILDLLQKMPSCITVDGIDYHFVLKKTASVYTAYYEALQIDSPILPILWMTSLSPIDLLTEMLEILKEKGLLE